MKKKSELFHFSKKKIEKIQSKYKVEQEIEETKNNIQLLREETQRYQKALFYKNALDNEEIKEEDIPIEYVEQIRAIYKEEIARMQSIIDANSSHKD